MMIVLVLLAVYMYTSAPGGGGDCFHPMSDWRLYFSFLQNRFFFWGGEGRREVYLSSQI